MAREKVLIVDDERLVRWSLRQKVQEWGFVPVEADTGAAALAAIQNESPDLVLLDLRLPDISGMEVLHRFRQTGFSAPVIMITADARDNVRDALMNLGAFQFLEKPVDFDKLEFAVRTALESNRLKSENAELRGQVRRRTGYHEVIGV